MSKRNGGRNVSKKKLFPNAKRITNQSGKRVWILDGKEYTTFNELVFATQVELNKSDPNNTMSVKTKKQKLT
jgi:hypothetical protein